MKVLVLGAAGKTGSIVLDQALAAGHDVTAFVRDREELKVHGVRVVEGDTTDGQSIEKAVKGQDAVLDAVGGGHKAFLETDLETSTAHHVIQAMRLHRVRRLVVISMLGEGESTRNASFFYEHILLPTYLRGADKDKAAMEDEVRQSNLDWVILRPAVLKDKPASGIIKIYSAESGETAHSISRADLAAFMLQQLTTDEHLRQALTLANQ